MTVVETNEIDLAYDSFGDEADESILLIAGLGTQMIRWTVPFCEALAARGYRVIRFDNRDSGGSTHFGHCATPDFGALASALMAGERPDVPYTLHDMARDAIGLLDALAIERAHVIGRSMGGMIAQILASEHPGRVLSLTSIMSSTGNPMLPQAAPDVMAMMMRPAPDPVADEAGFLAHRLSFARRIAGTGHVFDEKAHRHLILEEARRAYDPGGSGRQLAAMAVAGDRRARLATITAPTLVIHGTEDPVIPPACGQDTAASIPHADLMLIDGMGHELRPALDRMVIDAVDRTARQSSRLRELKSPSGSRQRIACRCGPPHVCWWIDIILTGCEACDRRPGEWWYLRRCLPQARDIARIADRSNDPPLTALLSIAEAREQGLNLRNRRFAADPAEQRPRHSCGPASSRHAASDRKAVTKA